MGKAWSFVLALAALGVLGIFVVGHGQSVLRDASLLLIFAVLAVLAWGVALGTALYRVFTRGRAWGWAFVLVLFFWVPALPALLFGVSGIFSIFEHHAKPTPATIAPTPPARRARWSLPPVDRRLAAVSRSART